MAVGETLRRAVGKAVLATSHTKEQIGCMQPLQVGVGLRNATQAVAMGGRQQTVYGALGTFEGGPEQCVQLHRPTKRLACDAGAVQQPFQLLAFLLPAERAPILWGTRCGFTDKCPPRLPTWSSRICTGDPPNDRTGADHSRTAVADVVLE